MVVVFPAPLTPMTRMTYGPLDTGMFKGSSTGASISSMSFSSDARSAFTSATSLRETRASRLPIMRRVASTPTSAERRSDSMSSTSASSMTVRAPMIWAIPSAIALRVFRNASPRRTSRPCRGGASGANRCGRNGSMVRHPRQNRTKRWSGRPSRTADHASHSRKQYSGSWVNQERSDDRSTSPNVQRAISAGFGLAATDVKRPAPKGAVRIIAGRWRRRLLPIAVTGRIRPTPDRVREDVVQLVGWRGRRCALPRSLRRNGGARLRGRLTRCEGRGHGRARAWRRRSAGRGGPRTRRGQRRGHMRRCARLDADNRRTFRHRVSGSALLRTGAGGVPRPS